MFLIKKFGVSVFYLLIQTCHLQESRDNILNKTVTVVTVIKPFYSLLWR